MSDEIELNTALHQKMMEEQEKYRNWLFTKPPERILKHAYMYAMREDILSSLEYWDLTEDQAKVLLELKNPLAAIYKNFENTESEHMDEIHRAVERCADNLLEKQWPRPKVEPMHIFMKPSIAMYGADITLTARTNVLIADSGEGKSYLADILENYAKINHLHSPKGVYVIRNEDDLKELRRRKFDIIVMDDPLFYGQSIYKRFEDYNRIKQAKHVIFMAHGHFAAERFDGLYHDMEMEVDHEKRMFYVKSKYENRT